MTRRPPPPPWNYENRRIERRRDVRAQRRPQSRPAQPLLFLIWTAGLIFLVGVLIVLGFNLILAPRLMAWVEENPGAIEHGLVQDFVGWYRPEVLEDRAAGDQIERVSFEIPEGATDTQIGGLLHEAGLIHSEIAFHLALIQSGREGTLAFGEYDLSPTLRPSEIIAAFKGQPVVETVLQIREGLRLEEVVAAMAATDPPLLANLEEVAGLLQDPPPELLNQYDFLGELREGRSLEGYLSPNTYRIDISDDPIDIVRTLLDQFKAELTDEVRAGIEAQGLTIDEAVIIASIVEREAVIDDERPMIAAVYINRYLNPELETVGLLNADPTVQYGLATREHQPQGHPLLEGSDAGVAVDLWGSVNWWPRIEVSAGDVEIPEHLMGYQTYLRPGLPPSPIASPRAGSIAAVANAPTDNGLLYFVAGCPDGQRDGSHYFAANRQEHDANVARAREECAGQ
jgi:UPF0755 protein